MRHACRLFLPASFAVFFLGLLWSGAVYFRSRPFDFKAAIISDLASPEENPHGYGAAAVGTAIGALLLAPVALFFHRQLRVVRRKLTCTGTVLFSLGLTAAIAIGLLAPFTRGYTPVHVQLANVAFMGICSGTLLWLIAAAMGAANAPSRRAAMGMAVLNGAALAILLFLYFGSIDFDNSGLLTSLAFCEWLLCAACAASLVVLACVS